MLRLSFSLLTFAFIERIIGNIKSCDEASILSTLSSVKAESCTPAILFQMKEEIIKAKLIKDASWKKEILDAELYFTLFGSIGERLDAVGQLVLVDHPVA